MHNISSVDVVELFFRKRGMLQDEYRSLWVDICTYPAIPRFSNLPVMQPALYQSGPSYQCSITVEEPIIHCKSRANGQRRKMLPSRREYLPQLLKPYLHVLIQCGRRIRAAMDKGFGPCREDIPRLPGSLSEPYCGFEQPCPR